MSTVSAFNPLTPKIQLVILPTYCHTSPSKLARRIWSYSKITPLADKLVCSHKVTYWNCKEKLHIMIEMELLLTIYIQHQADR